MIGITLKTMGKSFNETDPAVLDEAKAKLMELKPNIRTLAMNNLQDVILSGEASVGYMFTAQVVMALQANPELKVVYPEEGMGFGIDNLIVPLNAPHEDNAFSFINYIQKKEKRNYEDMDCLEVNLNVKAVIVYQGFLTQSHFC